MSRHAREVALRLIVWVAVFAVGTAFWAALIFGVLWLNGSIR